MCDLVYLTQAKLARELGVSQQRVSQLMRRGLLVLRNGYIERDLALRWIKARLKPGKSRWPDRGCHRVDELRRAGGC